MSGKRIKKKKRQFTVLIDAELLDQANTVRSETWPALVEAMLIKMIADAEKGDTVGP